MQFSVSVPAKLTKPADAAKWIFELEAAYAALRGEVEAVPRGADSDKSSEFDALLAMMRRWDDFNPADAQWRHSLIGKLQDLGYTLEEPVARSSQPGARTYMRVLRADGVNAGFFNSSTFTYVRSRVALPAHSELVKSSGRYPSTDLNSQAAVDFVARVVSQFNRMP
ncbi:MAG: hypothetical protein ACTHMS_03205 [Jatrophihabitans sp.]|uniref:hypothetical protein n=1 Tax=Jatrophihabitans sp. TaxID=1932789 RepID=UPI003F802D9C